MDLSQCIIKITTSYNFYLCVDNCEIQLEQLLEKRGSMIFRDFSLEFAMNFLS